MEDRTQEIIEKLNKLVASQSVLEHLTLALFDAIEDKDRVIKQFTDTTKGTHALTLYSSRPESFVLAFEEHRTVLLKLLIETQVASTSRHGGH